MENPFIVLIAIVFLIFVGPITYKLIARSRKGKLSSLKNYGIAIDARITKIQNEAVVNRPIVLCRIFAESQIDEQTYKFSSEKLYADKCECLKTGDLVKVLINRSNPKEYFFAYDPDNMEY